MSSRIPSWQILTVHAQPFIGARDLAFCLNVPLDSLLVWASSGYSGETARKRRLAWTFAARIGDKYQIRLTRPIYAYVYLEQHRIPTGNIVHSIPCLNWPVILFLLIVLWLWFRCVWFWNGFCAAKPQRRFWNIKATKSFPLLCWLDSVLSRLMTKPTKWLCARWRLRSTWASA